MKRNNKEDEDLAELQSDIKVTIRLKKEMWDKFQKDCPSRSASNTVRRLMMIYEKFIDEGRYDYRSFLLREWRLIEEASEQPKHAQIFKKKEKSIDPFKDL